MFQHSIHSFPLCHSINRRIAANLKGFHPIVLTLTVLSISNKREQSCENKLTLYVCVSLLSVCAMFDVPYSEQKKLELEESFAYTECALSCEDSEINFTPSLSLSIAVACLLSEVEHPPGTRLTRLGKRV